MASRRLDLAICDHFLHLQHVSSDLELANLALVSHRERFKQTKSPCCNTVAQRQRQETAARKWQKSARNHPNLPKSTKIYQNLPKSTKLYQNLPKSTKNFQKLPKTSENFRKLPKTSSPLEPKTSKNFQKLQKNFQKLPKTSKNFQKLPIWIVSLPFSQQCSGEGNAAHFFPRHFPLVVIYGCTAS